MDSDSASNFSVGACPRGECSKPKDVSVVAVAFAFAFDLQFWHFWQFRRFWQSQVIRKPVTLVSHGGFNSCPDTGLSAWSSYWPRWLYRQRLISIPQL